MADRLPKRRHDRLVALDRRHLWHPFTQMKGWLEADPVVISEGSGIYLTDTRGNRYMDGISSMWCNVHGHRKAELDEALLAQSRRISHSTLLGFTNPPAAELGAALVRILPSGLNRIFYSDNGSTAVEVALKMAFQFWQHRGERRRTKFLSLNQAYHGDTLGAVAVGGIDSFHSTFEPILMKGFKGPSHYCYRCELSLDYPQCGLACADRVIEMLEQHGDEIAAVILEPLIQGAGGMITAPPGHLRKIYEACRRLDVLLILDEIATGFGRTGRMFACEHEGVQPDIMCISKGLTGGYLPLAVTAATDRIFSAFLGEFRDLKTFFHGHTYTGNPLACSVALASLKLYEQDRILENLQPKVTLFSERLSRLSAHRHVGQARHAGLMAGIELVRDQQTRQPYDWEEARGWAVCNEALRKGLILRPLGNVVVLMPPLCINLEELYTMLDIVENAIETALPSS